MASEDLFEEDFSEEVINELDQTYASKHILEQEPVEQTETDANEVETEVHEELTTEEIVDSTENAIATNTTQTAITTEAKSKDSNENTTKKSTTEHKLFHLPLTRIRNIMKLDPDLHLASNEAVFCVTRATELFVESLARESYSFTAQAKKKTVQKRDVEFAIEAVDSLMFLEGAMNFT